MLRFLVSPRWIGLAVFTAFMLGACIWLAGWQHDRWEERKHDNAIVRTNQAADAVAVQDALGDGWTDRLEFLTVTATGTFLPEHETTVRFQTRDATPGVDVVTPMRLTSGETVLVDRGWIEGPRSGRAPDDIPAAPTGTVTITGWLQPDSSAGSRATTPRDGQVRAIDSASWSTLLGSTPLPGHVAQTAPETAGLTGPEDPDLGTGPHLFYSIQWYFFAALAVFGYGWFVRTEILDRRRETARAMSA